MGLGTGILRTEYFFKDIFLANSMDDPTREKIKKPIERILSAFFYCDSSGGFHPVS